MTIELLYSALLIGLLGSGHCLMMCGGFAGALQLMMQGCARQKLGWTMVASLGRLSSYALLGALFGAFGQLISHSHLLAPQILRLFSGLMLLAMALYVGRWWFGLLALERFGQRVWRYVQPWQQRVLPIQSIKSAYLYGLGWGFLPCGLVYSALSWALGSANALSGSLWMFWFGVGTLPAVLLLGQMHALLQRMQRNPVVRQGLAFSLFCYATYTIYLALVALLF